MAGRNQLQIDKDLTRKKITVTREFDAEPEVVWRAWTERELLDQWWAPKPWRAETKSIDFREGGYWLYAMVGPDDSKHWARVDYKKINLFKSFEAHDFFCDENGNQISDMPDMNWKNQFISSDGGTKVIVEISFAKDADIQKIIEMGFEAGFTAALENLDQYLAERGKLRMQMKTNTKSRTSTYLNFPGNTEEVFNFYKSVFGSEFTGNGIQRFGEIPAEAGQPPVADSVKNMVLHVELPILGGHILMATDAPAEMGFTVIPGNNMYINLEPETKAETKKLFDALSQGGNISMQLADMFWGAYYGSCTDKFGINWMFNCTEK